MAATIRVPSDANPARRAAETRSFGTTKREVLALADWLRSWQVPAVVMEATGDYWKPVFYRLEAEGVECVLADARQVKNLPGRPKRRELKSALQVPGSLSAGELVHMTLLLYAGPRRDPALLMRRLAAGVDIDVAVREVLVVRECIFPSLTIKSSTAYPWHRPLWHLDLLIRSPVPVVRPVR